MSAMRQTEALFSVSTLPGYTSLADISRRPHSREAPESRRQPVVAKGGQQAPPPAQPAQPAQPHPKGSSEREGAAWVATDDDVADYFARQGSNAPCKFFFCLRDEGGGAGGGCAADVTAGRVDLRVVPQERVQHAPHYFIISQHTVVRVDRRSGEHTDAVPLEEWIRHKRAFLQLRKLTFFGSHMLCKCFGLWRAAARARVLRRRQHELQQALFLAWPDFQGPLLQASALLNQMRAMRAVAVQPGQLHSTGSWAEHQASWRSRKVQPELEAVSQQLVRVAEGVCLQVEASAAHMQASVRPQDLEDRIGVDLYAATSKAKARSMQQIKQDKVDKTRAYHRALANRRRLPRLLRMLDLRAAGALAELAVESVADAANMLHAAAPGIQLGVAGGDAEAAEDNSSEPVEAAGEATQARAAASTPGGILLCSVVFAPDGRVELKPSEAEWQAALVEEAARSSLDLAGSVPALLTLPAFEAYCCQAQQQLAADIPNSPEQAAEGTSGEQWAPKWAPQLSQEEAAFTGALADMAGLVRHSFTEAEQVLAQQYQQYQKIHSFGQEFDFEVWSTRQRAAMDLDSAQATLRQLQQWQQQLEGMPLACTTGLLRLDAAAMQSELLPVVCSAQERISGLLLALAGDKCRQLVSEVAMWLEVARARPAELDGFLPWAAELARMQLEAARLLAEAAAADAALGLVLEFDGRLPPAEAVKRDDLKEAVVKLQGELGAAAAWQVKQRAVQVAAVAGQVEAVREEAIILEGEMAMGQYQDASAASGEVLADLELQQSRVAQLAAQAQHLAMVQQELGEGQGEAACGGMPMGCGAEIRDAELAVERRMEVWGLVTKAEAFHARLGDRSLADADLQQQLAALQEQLQAAAGGQDAAAPPDAVWERAQAAVLACRGILALLR